jgi:hypothetical protein
MRSCSIWIALSLPSSAGTGGGALVSIASDACGFGATARQISVVTKISSAATNIISGRRPERVRMWLLHASDSLALHYQGTGFPGAFSGYGLGGLRVNFQPLERHVSNP